MILNYFFFLLHLKSTYLCQRGNFLESIFLLCATLSKSEPFSSGRCIVTLLSCKYTISSAFWRVLKVRQAASIAIAGQLEAVVVVVLVLVLSVSVPGGAAAAVGRRRGHRRCCLLGINNSRLTRKTRPSHTEEMASAGDASHPCPKPSPAPHLPEGVYNKCNATRYLKHTLSCSGPRKKSERPQWSPCGGRNDGCGGLGATWRQHQRRGGDDDIRPAAQLARLAATPAVVVPLYQVLAQRSAARFAVLRWAAVP
jgi:hypothetical protein